MAIKKSEPIVIEPIRTEFVDITIVGLTPLIVHAWSQKAKIAMLNSQTGKKKGAKHEIKIPVNDFMDSLYWLTEQPEHGENDTEAESNWISVADTAKFGFPCNGIKASIISGAQRAGLSVVKTEMNGTMFLEGCTESSTVDLAEIVGPAPEMREDMVRLAGPSRVADIRYRAEFKEWEIPLRIKYLKNGKYSLEQILNMINYGGFVTGIGEWRPEKKGQFGMYELKVN